MNDSLGGQALVIVAQSGAEAAARAYQRDSNTFSPARATPDEEEAPHLLDREGDRWRVAEDALVSVDDPGRRLERLPAHMAYWVRVVRLPSGNRGLRTALTRWTAPQQPPGGCCCGASATQGLAGAHP